MDLLHVLLCYVRARWASRSDEGMHTIEILVWTLAVVVLGSVIVTVVFTGWLNDANDIARTPRPAGP